MIDKIEEEKKMIEKSVSLIEFLSEIFFDYVRDRNFVNFDQLIETEKFSSFLHLLSFLPFVFIFFLFLFILIISFLFLLF